MTIRYVGSGGNDSSDGLSWANRKLTLNGVEDTPVVSGDTVYVGPGIYREQLTVDVSGGVGSYISYIADVTGAYTDGIGGVVRITGSDNDTTATRSYNITCGAARTYRKFTGFFMDTTTTYNINTGNYACNYWTISDCSFQHIVTAQNVYCGGQTNNWTIQRCSFITNNAAAIIFTYSSTYDNSANLVQNCIFNSASKMYGVQSTRVGGITVKNCSFMSCYYGVLVATAIAVGQTVTVNNCIFANNYHAVEATATGEITENYNTFWANQVDRTLTNTGANSVAYPPLFAPNTFLSGYIFPMKMGELSSASQVARIAGTSEATDDLYGITRPTTSAKKSWGAVQQQPVSRSTTQTYGTSTSSLKLSDAGRWQMWVKTSGVELTVSVRVYRESNYDAGSGTLPKMVIKQDGQSDRTTTDAGSAATWNELTDTFTPAATPGWVVVELVSDNAATSGSYNVYFDALTITAT